jgi:hypothetical protein
MTSSMHLSNPQHVVLLYTIRIITAVLLYVDIVKVIEEFKNSSPFLYVQLRNTCYVQVLLILWMLYEACHRGYKQPDSRAANIIYGILDSLFDGTIGILQVRGDGVRPWLGVSPRG